MSFDLAALEGIWRGGLPQVPLTLLNSVFAVAALAAQLYPQHAERITPTRMALSVGIMNMIVCPLGGMPLCHGSGGLAGQHKLGARSGVSVVMLGAAKLTLGLLFGGMALAWMRAFPQPVLGLFLLLAGWSLAEASRVWTTRAGIWVSLTMVGAYYGSGLLLLAFGAGWAVSWFVQRGRPADE
jgi:MFS superfamily sulfate permease-like transporter